MFWNLGVTGLLHPQPAGTGPWLPVSLQDGKLWRKAGRAEGTARLLTYWEAGFDNDRLGDLPEAIVLIPAALAPDLLQVAVVTVPANQGLHLLQELLEEHKVTLLTTDGGQVIDLL